MADISNFHTHEFDRMYKIFYRERKVIITVNSFIGVNKILDILDNSFNSVQFCVITVFYLYLCPKDTEIIPTQLNPPT